MEQMTRQPESQSPVSAAEPQGSGGLTAEQVYACGRRLALLAGKIDRFLGTQLNKLERAGNELRKEAECYAAWEQMSRDLREEQSQWEQQKAEQAQRIAEELEFLTAAWDRIEAERRRLLAGENDGHAGETAVAAAPSPPLPTPEPPPLNLFDFESPVTGRSAALQFQQIKREIRQHARRNS